LGNGKPTYGPFLPSSGLSFAGFFFPLSAGVRRLP
jgi:hypothetical protein